MTTITTTINKGIVLSTAGTYTSPLTIAATGAILNSDLGDAVFGDISQAWTVVNIGAIKGGAGSGGATNFDAGGAGDTGGHGVHLGGTGTLTNAGTIAGGQGGGGGSSVFDLGGNGGVGGNGAHLGAGGQMTNSGTIAGGQGGVGGSSLVGATAGGAGGTGGAGIALMAGGTIDNNGRITGGQGGANTGLAAVGGHGGAGVALAGPGFVRNMGTIVGGSVGTGGVGALAGIGFTLTGGTAVLRNGTVGATTALISGRIGVSSGGTATIVNFGTISGDPGSYAVYFENASNTLLLQNGGTLIGDVFGGGGTLALGAEGGAGTLSGLGGQYTAFNHLTVHTGANWDLAGTTTITGDVTLAAGALLHNSAGALIRGVSGTAGAILGDAGAAGDTGIALSGDGFSNAGTIIGGAGGTGGPGASDGGTGGTGGSGITVSDGSIANTGTITGGHGGAGGNGISGTNLLGTGGSGGAGVLLLSGGTITNDGRITGGHGGDNTGLAATGGEGGAGIALTGPGTITNTGTVFGGSAGIGGLTTITGVGVTLAGGSTILRNGNVGVTTALISGRVGVHASGTATVVNYGRIIGEPGEYAVHFTSADNTLVLQNGSTLDGHAYGGGGTLALGADGGAGTLSALGTQYTAFEHLVVQTGADWTLAGTNTIAGGVTLNAGATLLNGATARIRGPAGADGTSTDQNGKDGGIAITLTGTGFINAGTINGGSGGTGIYADDFFGSGGTGGSAMVIAGGGGITNTGTVKGGTGGNGASSGFVGSGRGGVGGIGIALAAGGNVTNTGRIAGGNGGSVSGAPATAANGNTAIAFAGSGTIENAGTIVGGDAGTGAFGIDGVGIALTSGAVVIHNGSADNTTALISGHAGLVATGATDTTIINYGSIAGSGGSAITFGDGTNVLAIGGRFHVTGTVTGGAGIDTLAFLGSAAHPVAANLAALGLANFEYIQFGTGGYATLEIARTGTLDITITGFDQAGELIDLTNIGADGTITAADTTTDQITVVGSLGSLVVQFDSIDGLVFSTAAKGISGTSLTVACFVLGTMIRTPSGDRPVETLAPGDPVVTASGAVRPIRWVGHRHLDLFRHPNPDRARPIRIHAHAFGPDQPIRDLYVSPGHRVLCGSVLVPAELLVNGATVTRETASGTVTYFHIELDSHDLLLSENLASESYLDTGNRGNFENAGQPLTLHPDLRTAIEHRTARSCVAFVDQPAAVEPVWRMLAERAGRLGNRLPAAPETTDDPDLGLTIDGRRIEPLERESGIWRFLVPAYARVAWLTSRTVVPSDLAPWINDHRRLGVMVSQLHWETCGRVIPVALDHPALGDGWWEPEWHGPTRLCRWTAGAALVPVPAERDGALILTVVVAASLQYPLAANPRSAIVPAWRDGKHVAAVSPRHRPRSPQTPSSTASIRTRA